MTFGLPETAHDPTGDPSWITDYWKGEDVFILGSGPSLYGFDFERLKGKKSIACVHTINYSPYSEFMAVLDSSAIVGLTNKPGPDAPYHTFASQSLCGQMKSLEPSRYVTRVKTSRSRTTRVEDGAYSAFSSGYYATSIALFMGAGRIFLLGHDACCHKGRMHFYNTMEVKKEMPRGAHDEYRTFAHGWKAFSDCKNIYNCSDISQVDVFPRISIDEALQ